MKNLISLTKVMSLLAVLFVVFGSCKIKKSMATMDKSDFIEVKKAFAQEEIPGMQGAAIKDYLTIEINPLTDHIITYDHLFYQGRDFTIDMKTNKLRISLELGRDIVLDQNLRDDQALLYYTVDGNQHTLLISTIERKEAIHLP